MLNATSNTGLVGYIDVLLVNRETGKIEKHIRQKNQITEPFARWLLLGNLCTHNVSTGTITDGTSRVDQIQTADVNSISNLLGSYSAAHYQSIVTDCGTNAFGMYLLNKRVNITPFTQIPPYMDSSLHSMNDSTVVYWGTATSDDNVKSMLVNNATSKWSKLGSNPAFTTTYIKDDSETVAIESIVLGVSHTAFGNSGFDPRIVVFQSPPTIPTSWDDSWSNNSSSSANANKMKAPQVIDAYLVNKFLRTIKRDGVYGDGLYATNKQFMCYWDLGRKECFIPTAASASVENVLTRERYNTGDGAGGFFGTTVFKNKVSGGFAIGNGKAIRVNKGLTDSSNKTREIIISSLHNFLGTEVSSDIDYEIQGTITTTESTTIPETITNNCAPVMVARRGFKVEGGQIVDAPEEDRIEVFISMGVGEFTNAALGPTGTGIEIHKLTIPVGRWRNTTGTNAAFKTYFQSLAPSSPYAMKYHGRVAVLPYAIGRYSNGANARETVSTVNGDVYTFGTYDESDTGSQYYLPITHILNGVDLADWSYPAPDNAEKDRVPNLCANTFIQPGLIIQAGTGVYGTTTKEILTGRTGDCLFAVSMHPALTNASSTRIAMLVTDEGLNPVVVNLTHHWNQTQGLVMSGLNLASAITKNANQVLVVRYTYAFDISPAIPNAITNFTASVPDVNGEDSGKARQLNLSFNVPDRVERYLLRRSEVPYTSGLTAVGQETKVAVSPPLLTPINGTIVDTGLKPNTQYYYRLCAANTTGATEWVYANCVTNPYVEAVADPSDFVVSNTVPRSMSVSWDWEQPTPETDATYKNDVKDYFTQYNLQYLRVTGEPEATVPSALLELDEDDSTWTACTDDLSDYTTHTCTLSGLIPSQAYYLRIRAEIDETCYTTNPSTSGWVGLVGTAGGLTAPVAITNLVVKPSNYNRLGGDIDVSWSPQNDMQFEVKYKRTGESTWPQNNVVDVSDNHCVISLPYDAQTWGNIDVQVTPHNEDHSPESSSALIGTSSSKCRVLARAVIETKESYVSAFVDDVEYTLNNSLTNGDRLFTNYDVSGGTANSSHAQFYVWGDNEIPDGNDTLIKTCSRLKFVVSYWNRTSGSNSNIAMKCTGWKMPFKLSRVFIDSSTASQIKVKMSVYGGVDSTETLLGTLADVFSEGHRDVFTPDAGGYVYTTTAEIDTVVAPGINRIISVSDNNTYEYFKVIWEVESPSGTILTDDRDVLYLDLYMWGFFTDTYTGSNSIAIIE